MKPWKKTSQLFSKFFWGHTLIASSDKRKCPSLRDKLCGQIFTCDKDDDVADVIDEHLDFDDVIDEHYVFDVIDEHDVLDDIDEHYDVVDADEDDDDKRFLVRLLSFPSSLTTVSFFICVCITFSFNPNEFVSFVERK